MAEFHRIIIDTDTAGDDAAALIIAAKNPNIEILGVTVLAGNVSLEQGAKNALAVLELIDDPTPVYMGASTTFSGEEKTCFSVFGADGMGEADLIHRRRKTPLISFLKRSAPTPVKLRSWRSVLPPIWPWPSNATGKRC